MVVTMVMVVLCE